MPILKADGTEFTAEDRKGAELLTAEGERYQPPEILNASEMRVLERCFGLNKRNKLAHKNDYRLGVLPPDDPIMLLCNDLQRRGVIRMFIDGRGLSKKDFLRLKAGDLSKGAKVAQVTRYGAECFKATVRASEERMRAAARAEQAS